MIALPQTANAGAGQRVSAMVPVVPPGSAIRLCKICKAVHHVSHRQGNVCLWRSPVEYNLIGTLGG